MKNILIPTDFSSNASNAVEFGLRLFLNQDVTFHIVNTYFPPIAGPEIAISITDMLKSQSEKQMEKYIDDLRKDSRFESLRIESECVYGDVEFVLHKKVKTCKADLIIMGTKGASGIREVLVGSVTSAIVKQATIPVLAIPEGASYAGIKNVLFSVDYKETPVNIVKPLIELSKIDDSEVYVLNVHEGGDISKKDISNGGLELDKDLKIVKHDHVFQEDNNLENGIESYVTDYNINLLVMVKHERSFWENLFHESSTQKLCMHTHIPLLILTEKV